MADAPSHPPAAARPRLWNPNAAANWSLLLTPAFGAYLHARNWRALGRPDRAAANLRWAWATVAVLVAAGLADGLAARFAPAAVGSVDGADRGGLALVLFGWYFAEARPQVRHVRDTLVDDYERRGWGVPLVLGFAVPAVLVALASVPFDPVPAVPITPTAPAAADVAAEVRPLVLREWAARPAMAGATIRDVVLIHKGGNEYAGYVDATIAGRPERLPLDVVADGATVRWRVRPATAPDHGTRLEFRGGELYFTPAVREDEARRLGEYLVREGFFDGDPKTVQLDKAGRTYAVRLVAKTGVEHDPQVVDGMREFAAQVSAAVFAAAPVDIHLCDDQFRTVRTVIPLP